MAKNWRSWRAWCDSEQGASAIEFAIILPVLLLLLFGIIEFGIILFDKAVITNASREAARERTNFNALEEGAIKANILESYGSFPITFGDDVITTEDISFTSATDPTGTFITATINFNYDSLLLPIGRLSLASRTTMRQEGGT